AAPRRSLPRGGDLPAAGGTRAVALGLRSQACLQRGHQVDDLRRRAPPALRRLRRAALELALDRRLQRVAVAVAILLGLPRALQRSHELQRKVDLAAIG